MSHKLLIEKFAKYQKMAQMGAGIRVKFHHPQYFAPSAKKACAAVEQKMNLDLGELFNYKQIEAA